MKLLFGLLLVMCLSSCVRHSSINYLYPEFAGKKVELTRPLCLSGWDEQIFDDKYDHPKYQLLDSNSHRCSRDARILEVGQIVFIERFEEHAFYTQSSTEAFGYVEIKNRQYKFYIYINGAFGGVKKSKEIPWKEM